MGHLLDYDHVSLLTAPEAEKDHFILMWDWIKKSGGRYMWQYIAKVILTALVVVVVSEVAKRWTLMGAVIASLPLTSILALIWLYAETKSTTKVMDLSWGIFWVVIPSLLFFVTFPLLIKWGGHFWLSLSGACAVTALGYLGYLKVLTKIGVNFS